MHIKTSPQPCCGRDSSLPVFAMEGLPLPTGAIDLAFEQVVDSSITTNDFDLAILTRVVYLSDDDEDARSEILDRLQLLYDNGDVRLWLTPGETHFTYWTENHIFLWLSSTWLLRSQIQLRSSDEGPLETRLRHALSSIFLTNGNASSYEFFSSNYWPFTLGALLNLYDFATEEWVKSGAARALDALLRQALLFVNQDYGSYFPVAGRNMARNYLRTQTQSMIWFMTTHGTANTNRNSPPGIPQANDFYAGMASTSTFDFSSIAASWQSSVDTRFTLGTSIAELPYVHAALMPDDRILWQWAAGGYLEPDLVTDTNYLIRKFGLEDHRLLREIGVITYLVQFGFTGLWQRIFRLVAGQSEGWDTAGAEVTIWKQAGVVLSSLTGFNVGRRAAQQWPWMATVGDIPVWTQAGVLGEMFENGFLGGDFMSNTHLPQVVQHKNVCLIAYKPRLSVILARPLLKLVGEDGYTTRVGLFFPEDRFDEVVESNRWIMGRRDNNYVGIWRHSTEHNSCDPATPSCVPYFSSDPQRNRRAQSWAAVVGNDETYGSFAEFQSRVSSGQVTEQLPDLWWSIITFLFGFTYQSTLIVDGTTLTASI